jgi:hypothetical protein
VAPSWTETVDTSRSADRRRFRRLGRRRAGLAAPLLLLASCLQPSYGYLSQPDGGFALRYPRHWDEVPTAPTGAEWVRAVDAADPPSSDHLESYAVGQPFLVAQVLPLSPGDADTYTLARLRQLAHPDRVDPTTVEDGSVRMHFDQPVRTDDGFEGHHLRFELEAEGSTVTVEHFAALAPDRSTVYRVRVACLVDCFEQHASDIEDVFDSIDLSG